MVLALGCRPQELEFSGSLDSGAVPLRGFPFDSSGEGAAGVLSPQETFHTQREFLTHCYLSPLLSLVPLPVPLWHLQTI